MTRRGLVLLIVIGVLGVLVVLSVAFVTMARLERKASEQRLNATRALLLARSGIEDALARLAGGQDPSLGESRYGGEDADLSGGALSGFEAAQEVFRCGTADVETCPVRHALRPSFAARSGLIGVDGRQRGVSGRLSAGTAVYSLKVEDESAKINVNGGFLDAEDRDNDGIPDHRDPFVAETRPFPASIPAAAAGIGRGFNGPLARILGILVSQPELGLPALPTAGTDILLGRPAGGYRSVAQVQAVLGTTVDLSPYLTVSSWVDAKVVHPNAYATESSPYFALSELKKARLPLRLEEGGRPPVNLNAASRPVLVALIQGLKGNSWYRIVFQPCTPHVYEITPVLAGQIADAIRSFREGMPPFPGWSSAPERPAPSPFGSWEHFAEFSDGLVPTLINGMVQLTTWDGGTLGGSALLKANFDPNTHLNKQLPDELMYYWLDKSDLTVASTEGSLGPTGIFQVSCVGRVLGPDGRLLAERALSSRVEAFALLRQTSQKDFVGDRSLFADYLSLSSDPVFWATAGASVPAWAVPGGMAATTYPCPPAAVKAGNAADFDGCIGLATMEAPSSIPPGAQGSPFFLHHFDDAWDGDVGTTARITPGPGTPASDSALQSDATLSVWPDSTLPPSWSEPNTLYPDGMHAQRWRSPAYSTGNFPPATWVSSSDPAILNTASNRGVISYWVKSAPSIPYSPHITCIRFAGGGTQTLMTGQQTNILGMMVENKVGPDNSPPNPAYERTEEQVFDGVFARMPGLRWQLMTCRFDTDEDAPGKYDLGCDVRAFGASPPDMAPFTPASYQVSFADQMGEDLFEGTPSFVVGYEASAGYPMPEFLVRPNHVLDELAICDFGDVATGASGSALASGLWAADRYRDGRYYKGNDGAFLSIPLEPEGGRASRLLSVRWTEYLPRENRQEALEGFVLNTATWALGSRKLDPALAASRLEVDLLEAGGTLQTNLPLRRLRQGAPLGLSRSTFRYRVRFLPDPRDPASGLPDPAQPVLESPWFDDITFVWQRSSGPRVLAARMGE